MKIEIGSLYMIRTHTTLRIVRMLKGPEGRDDGETIWYCEVLWPHVRPGQVFKRWVSHELLEPIDLLLLGRNFQDLAQLLRDQVDVLEATE